MNKYIIAAFFALIALSENLSATPIGNNTGNTGGYVLCKNGAMYGYYNPGSADYGPDVSYASAVEKCKKLGGGLGFFNPRLGPIRAVNPIKDGLIKIQAEKPN